MRTAIELPKAFSVRDENEFLPFQHLMERMSPDLLVTRVATGVHVSGGPTVFWGLVHMDGQALSQKDVENALREAGFDFGHNVLVQLSDMWTSGQKEAA
jgi:hypothetical protein